MKVNFFIVGAPKSGTTSLYNYLNQHPEIVMSSQKEPDYFSDYKIQKQGLYYTKNRIDTIEKYIKLFDTTKKKVIYGEASVSYLFYEDIAKNIKEYNSDAKIIILLRNPIDRAFSHYLMDYRLGFVKDTFENIIFKKTNHKDRDLFFQQYLSVGEYAKQIERYLDVFAKKDILIIDYEDFSLDLNITIKRIFSFLNVNDKFLPDLKVSHNKFVVSKNILIRFLYSYSRIRNLISFILPQFLLIYIRHIFFQDWNKPQISNKTRTKLKDYFADDIMSLSNILDKDYSRWIK